MRMSSGASVAYENPRSGRSTCIDESPRSRSTASARTPFAASCERTTRVVAAQEARLYAARRRLHAIEVRPHGRIAVDRDELPGPLQVGGQQPRVAARAEGGVDDRLARLHVEELAHLVREHGDVISRVCPLHVRQHLRRSLRSR